MSPFLIVPEVSSENRDYAPIGYASPPTIPSNLVRVLPDADLYHFAILTSRMHMAWLRHVGGRLKSDYRYSIGIVYNTFPWPEADDKAKDKIRALAQAVLDARAAHPGATLADLYDADLMPPDLRRAHRELDAAVDKLYRREAFSLRPRPRRAPVRGLRKTRRAAAGGGAGEEAEIIPDRRRPRRQLTSAEPMPARVPAVHRRSVEPTPCSSPRWERVRGRRACRRRHLGEGCERDDLEVALSPLIRLDAYRVEPPSPTGGKDEN